MARLMLLLSTLLLTACNSFPAKKTQYTPGSVLVLPPRDVVQDGAPHPEGGETGRILFDYLLTYFRKSTFEPVETDASTFNNEQVADKEAALAEAKRLGAAYCLQLVLGEFRDAAAMTFRPDYVMLDNSVMWATATGEQVWWQTKPYQLRKGNIGGINGLLKSFASRVVRSITR